jgi:hypothetical protein
VESGIEVAAFLAFGGESTLYQHSLEPQVAFSQPGGTALPGTLIVVWTQPGPRQEVPALGNRLMSRPISDRMT